MDNSIFRQKSIDRISSPEEFDEYVKVANPGLWGFLGAVVFFLVGVFVFAQFGTVDAIVDCAVMSDGDTIIAYVDEDDIGEVKVGMPIRVEGQTVKIKSIPEAPSYLSEDEAAGIIHLMSSSKDDLWTYECVVEGNVGYGLHSGEIVTQSVKPMRYIIGD